MKQLALLEQSDPDNVAAAVVRSILETNHPVGFAEVGITVDEENERLASTFGGPRCVRKITRATTGPAAPESGGVRVVVRGCGGREGGVAKQEPPEKKNKNKGGGDLDDVEVVTVVDAGKDGSPSVVVPRPSTGRAVTDSSKSGQKKPNIAPRTSPPVTGKQNHSILSALPATISVSSASKAKPTKDPPTPSTSQRTLPKVGPAKKNTPDRLVEKDKSSPKRVRISSDKLENLKKSFHTQLPKNRFSRADVVRYLLHHAPEEKLALLRRVGISYDPKAGHYLMGKVDEERAKL